MKKYVLMVLVLGLGYCTLLDNRNPNQVGFIARSMSPTKIWQELGEERFGDKEERKVSIEVYEGVVYRTFIDTADGNKISVMKYNDNREEWEYVGGRGFRNGVKEADLVVNSRGVFVVVIDSTIGNRVTVFEFSGNEWEYVGFQGVSPRNIENIAIEADANNIYVGYTIPREGKAVEVMSFTNNEWICVGNVGEVSEGGAKELSLELDTAGMLYTAYIDMVNGEKATVMKYNGISWICVGEKGFTAAAATKLSFTIDKSSNIPYLTYTQLNGYTILMKLEGISWVKEGGENIPIINMGYVTLGVEAGNSYIGYRDSLNGKATVIAYKNGWQYIGNAHMSAGRVKDMRLVVEEGVAYLGYKDESYNDKVVVVKYDEPPVPKEYEWVNVGTAGFSAGVANYTSLEFSPDGVPYAAYGDEGNSSKATVMRYNGSSWENAGRAGFSAGTACFTSLEFSPDGVPYVAYRDGENSSKATVMSYNEGINAWQYVGNAGFSAGGAYWTSLEFSPEGVPYVAYMDRGNSDKATVMSYNEGINAWQYVGTGGFSAGGAYCTSLEFSPDGVPYVAYRDKGNSYKATVMKYNGSVWENVGIAGFSVGEAIYTSLKFSPDGVPYAAYRDVGHQNKATVMRYNGEDWEYVGSPGFSAGQADWISFEFSPDGVPYAAYRDGGNSYKATVMKYNGSAWENVGRAGFSAGSAVYTSLEFSPDGTPYVAYRDYENSHKATVMKLQEVTE